MFWFIIFVYNISVFEQSLKTIFVHSKASHGDIHGENIPFVPWCTPGNNQCRQVSILIIPG